MRTRACHMCGTHVPKIPHIPARAQPGLWVARLDGPMNPNNSIQPRVNEFSVQRPLTSLVLSDIYALCFDSNVSSCRERLIPIII